MFSFIRKFFSVEKKEEDPLLFWAFLGPFFLLFTFSFLGVAYLDLWTMAFLGLLLCWKMKRQGCLIALFLLLILGLYQHAKIDEHLWRCAIELSLGLSLLITNFSLEHLFAQISSLGTHRANLLQSISFKEEEMRRADSFHLQQQRGLLENIHLLQKELLEKKEKISSLELLIRTLKRALIEEKRERENFLSSTLEAERRAAVLSYELEEMKKENEILREKNPTIGLIDDLNTLRQKQYQQELLEHTKEQTREEEKAREQMQQTIQELLAKVQELQKGKEGQNSFNEKKQKELKTLQSLYHQLRGQFKEKDAILHLARKELFAASEKLLAQEKEFSLCRGEAGAAEKALIRDFIQTSDALALAEEESCLLEEIIASLSQQAALSSLPPEKKRGRKKKTKDETQELLFKNS